VLVLTVLQGPDKGRRYELPDNEPQLVGRSSEALPLSDIYAAEYQALRGRPYHRAFPLPILHGSLTHPRVKPLFFPAHAP